MYRFVPMISAEEISLPKDRRCLRFKCNSFYELNAVNTLPVQLPVHDLSAANHYILRFKYSSTLAHIVDPIGSDPSLTASGIHWDELDEDISVAGLLAGRGDATRSTKIAA